MLKHIRTIILIIFLASCKPAHQIVTEGQKHEEAKESIYPASAVSAQIKSLLSPDKINLSIARDKEYIQVEKMYHQNNDQPFWPTKQKAAKGIDLIKGSLWHGLNPENYFIAQTDSLFNRCWESRIPDTAAFAVMDILLTQGIYKLCEHLVNGKLLPADYHKSWNYRYPSSINIDSVLLLLINDNKIDTIDNYFQPRSEEYAVMLNEVKRLSELKSSHFDYSAFQYPGEVIRKADSNYYVIQLRQALSDRKFITNDTLNYIFDEQLELAVKNFQAIHGLTCDGIPGPNTCTFLNWKIDDYIHALRVNMERIRWMPDSSPSTNLQVNIPSCEIFLYNNKQLIFNGRVIVGKYKNQTPVLTSRINYLVFNPCWTVPASIAAEKILPRLKKDTSYLNKRNMFITLNGTIQQHDSIDFSNYNKTNFPFKIYQRTDDKNALGKVKFMFPNPYDIYLHDTPGKSLFTRDYRTFSHGCVRVQNALGLSKIILLKLDNQKIEQSDYLKKGYPAKLYLHEGIPINITYFTCRYNDKLQKLQYFKDVYGLDDKILEDLDKK
jgi:L,D-transpeptidase YcbB